MKALTLIILVTLGTVMSARAAIQLVDLTVRKSTKQEIQQAPEGKNSDPAEATEVIAYTIEALNRSAGALPDLTIKWAVLVHSGRVIDGERKVSLDFGQRTIFYTDRIGLFVHRDEEGRYGDKIEGYVVEVFQGTNVLASKAIPMAVKQRIEVLQSKRKKN